MTMEYTPGALGALMTSSAKKDNKQKSSNVSTNLVELFKTKKLDKNKNSKIIKPVTIENKKEVDKPEHVKQKLKNEKPIDAKCEIAVQASAQDECKDLINTIGPTVIPSRDSKHTDQLPKKEKRKKTVGESNIDDSNQDSAFSGPSLKFKVIEEDKKQRQHDPEKEARTVFVGNLPSNITGKTLKRKFQLHGEIETVRIRSVARPDMKTTKKTAAIKRKFHENRNNVNAYIRFKDKQSAMDSCKLNGADIDNHIIRVDAAGLGKSNLGDSQASQQHDQSRAVFLGNVKFNEQEDNIRKHFEKCGYILDVRLVRDTSTGIGKGFGYVNFDSGDSVEKAIRLNGSILNDRSLRVSRAVNRPKQTLTQIEKKKASGPFKPKSGSNLTNNKSFSKISKKKQRGLTVESYRGTQIGNKEKLKKTKKAFNKNEKRRNIISKKLTLPKKQKLS